MRCTQCERCGMRCDINLVPTQIMAPLNVARKWVVGTGCTGWVMLFVCMGKTLYIILGELGILDVCMQMKVSH